MHVDMEEVYSTLQLLCSGRRTLSEAVPLATCARFEVYGVAPDARRSVPANLHTHVRTGGYLATSLASHLLLRHVP